MPQPQSGILQGIPQPIFSMKPFGKTLTKRCWTARSCSHSNSSNCLVLILHRQLGNYCQLYHVPCSSSTEREGKNLPKCIKEHLKILINLLLHLNYRMSSIIGKIIHNAIFIEKGAVVFQVICHPEPGKFMLPSEHVILIVYL